MPETQEKLLSVEKAQEKVRQGSIYTVDSDKTPAEIEEEKKAEEERLKLEEEKEALEAKELAEQEAGEKAEREAKEAEETKAKEEAEVEEARLAEEKRLEEEGDKSVKFTYKSHEEAEKGAQEAKRKMHEATLEAKSLKEEIDTLRQETSEAVKTGEIDKKEGDIITNVFEEMLGTIDELDPSDSDYRKKLAKAWDGGIEKRLSLHDEKRDAEIKAKQTEEDANKSIFNRANVLATKAGLDMEIVTNDNGNPVTTIDYDLFWNVVGKGNLIGDTEEERINWVIEAVKQKRGQDREQFTEQQKTLSEKSKKAQSKNKVLEKGVSKVADKESKEEAPLSIAEALQRSERRV